MIWGSFLWAAAPPVSLSEVTGVHMTSMAVLLLGGSSRVTEAGGTGRLAAVATRYGETSAKLSSSTPLMASTRVLALALETEKGRVIHAWFRKKPEKISTYNIRIIYIIHRYCYTIYVYDSHWGSHHSISMVEINVETMVEKKSMKPHETINQGAGMLILRQGG